MSLDPAEMSHLEYRLGRKPTDTELHIVAAEWSEHCSYKSSRIHLRSLVTDGPRVIKEPGYDSGILDVGDGYVVTVHIESHNHPSAVEPYGGAATGVGGVVRDIISAGTRPIALLDCLRFGDIENDGQARWLFKNAVAGIADYGNCLGIPTVGGEVEFDPCYTNYALVDVACVGFGKQENLIRNRVDIGDCVILLGGHTGRDGIGGAQFASDHLDDHNRSAVQIPDPFVEKLIIEAIIEARRDNIIKALKDLGGGGLSCAISETADSLGVGLEIDVDAVHVREPGMRPEEIMTSESQERMLIITDNARLGRLEEIAEKYRIRMSVIGRVVSGRQMRVRQGGNMLADMPAEVVANALLLKRQSRRPSYLDCIQKDPGIGFKQDLTGAMLKLLQSPNIASKHFVYGQYDHEVGIRTVVRPGLDAAVLRLDNGRFLSIKIDGNPKHCYIDPYHGAVGCFEEACRNVVCTGASPIGMIDHLQFGNPENPEIFWTFLESLRGLIDFSKYYSIPCVGGKVSLYNETARGPIKPTPLVGVLGLSERPPPSEGIKAGDLLFMAGRTYDEMGGSEYYEYVCRHMGGRVPHVRMSESKNTMDSVLQLGREGLLKRAHDCSKGGMAIAVIEMCVTDTVGCHVCLDRLPAASMPADRMLFSESHSRYLLAVDPRNESRTRELLLKNNITHDVLGRFGGDAITFDGRPSVATSVMQARQIWMDSLEAMLHA